MTGNFLVFGDINGKLDLMYKSALAWQTESGESLDAILQVGDFTPIRNDEDLALYWAPERHPVIKDFADYSDGSKQAPILTIFIAGNHEPWGFLNHRDGGEFIAPNIYYLGRSGVIEVKDIKIGGLSGIYNQELYRNPLSEPNYNWKYYRESAVDWLAEQDINILLLHQWPQPIIDIEIEDSSNIPEGPPNPARSLIE